MLKNKSSYISKMGTGLTTKSLNAILIARQSGKGQNKVLSSEWNYYLMDRNNDILN